MCQKKKKKKKMWRALGQCQKHNPQCHNPPRSRGSLVALSLPPLPPPPFALSLLSPLPSPYFPHALYLLFPTLGSYIYLSVEIGTCFAKGLRGGRRKEGGGKGRQAVNERIQSQSSLNKKSQRRGDQSNYMLVPFPQLMSVNLARPHSLEGPGHRGQQREKEIEQTE